MSGNDKPTGFYFFFTLSALFMISYIGLTAYVLIKLKMKTDRASIVNIACNTLSVILRFVNWTLTLYKDGSARYLTFIE